MTDPRSVGGSERLTRPRLRPLGKVAGTEPQAGADPAYGCVDWFLYQPAEADDEGANGEPMQKPDPKPGQVKDRAFLQDRFTWRPSRICAYSTMCGG
jgi:hypothetical protein